jgi:outer membrane protein OmpA-like peptidoglycan-associated protein/Mg-chelatase subunit ChlD
MKKCIPLMMVMVMSITFTFISGAHCREIIRVTGPEIVSSIEVKELEDSKLLVSAFDSQGNPVLDLKKEDLTVSRNEKIAQILSLEPLATSQKVSLNIVMVVDNSFSMKLRNAVKPALSAVENIFSIVRPIDNVTIIVFQDRDTTQFGNRNLHVKIKQSSDVEELRSFLNESFDRGLTEKTYLYEAMLAGLLTLGELPSDANNFMVIFSDGQDINSAFGSSVVMEAARQTHPFEAYAIDYMPEKQLDPFLNSFSTTHGGQAWKAYKAGELPSIFEAVSSKMIHRYVLSYRFFLPPTGSVSLVPDLINIEEITTVESSPMLNYIYFDTGKSVILDRYATFERQQETEGYSEADLRGSREKYLHVLNIIGSRLQQKPEATIRIIGCNSDYGEEKGRIDLSRARAESVRAYLQYIWGVSPGRMEVLARNLPEVPSTSRIQKGREENQRVEIHSSHPELLEPVRSTYIEVRSDTESIRFLSQIDSEHGLDSWKITFLSDDIPVDTLSGDGALPSVIMLLSEAFRPENLVQYNQLKAQVVVKDIENHTFETTSAPIKINSIRKEQLLAQDLGYMVEEKYALILFDFDRAEIKERNEAIVDHIVNRIEAIEDVAVNIVGHTDIIGDEDYNIRLSQRRAKAVYDKIITALGTRKAAGVQYSGVGPFDPLHDNMLPENRALNRTVTITLIYQERE